MCVVFDWTLCVLCLTGHCVCCVWSLHVFMFDQSLHLLCVSGQVVNYVSPVTVLWSAVHRPGVCDGCQQHCTQAPGGSEENQTFAVSVRLTRGSC